MQTLSNQPRIPANEVRISTSALVRRAYVVALGEDPGAEGRLTRAEQEFRAPMLLGPHHMRALILIWMVLFFSGARANEVAVLSPLFTLDTIARPSHIGGSASSSSGLFTLDTRTYLGPFFGGSDANSGLFTLDTSSSSTGAEWRGIVMQPEGTLRLELQAQLGWQYDVETSTNLLIWQYLETITATNAVMSFLDSNAAGVKSKFYRVVIRETVSQP